MEFVLSIKDLNSLDKIKADVVLIGDVRYSSGFGFEDVIEASKAVKEAGLKCWLRLDRLYHEDELAALKEYLTEVYPYFDGILFTDLGIKVMKDKLNLDVKLIYAPETLLTNKYDVKELSYDGIENCVISKDIPLNDVLEIIKDNPEYCYLRIHGPILLAYSARHYIGSYLEDYKEYKNGYYLVEENRAAHLPIIEKEKGSWVYGNILESYEEIKMLSETELKGVIIDNIIYDDDYSLEVLENYKDILADRKTANEVMSSLDDKEYISLSLVKKSELVKEKHGR